MIVHHSPYPASVLFLGFDCLYFHDEHHMDIIGHWFWRPFLLWMVVWSSRSMTGRYLSMSNCQSRDKPLPLTCVNEQLPHWQKHDIILKMSVIGKHETYCINWISALLSPFLKRNFNTFLFSYNNFIWKSLNIFMQHLNKIFFCHPDTYHDLVA